MDIVGFRVEEAYVAIEISLSEIKKLKKALDNSTLNYDSTVKEQKDYYDSFMGFYNLLKDSLKELEADDEL
jgi:hypothetical protein